MKNYFAILVLELLLTCSAHPKGTSGPALKGPVKTVRIETAQVSIESGRWTEAPRVPSEVSTYDGKGNIMEGARYDPSGKLYHKSVCSYDAKGNQLEWSDYEADGSFRQKSVRVYDAKGNVIEDTSYDAQGFLEDKTISDYDEMGNEIRSTYSKADGSLHYSVVYFYDQEGNQTGWVSQHSEGSFSVLYTLAAGGPGRVDHLAVYKPDGLLDHTDTLTRDAKGIRTEETQPGPDGSLREKWVYTYDDKGHLLEEALYGSDGLTEKTTFTYEFDSVGNWIKKTAWAWLGKSDESHFEPTQMIYRVLTYYSESQARK